MTTSELQVVQRVPAEAVPAVRSESAAIIDLIYRAASSPPRTRDAPVLSPGGAVMGWITIEIVGDPDSPVNRKLREINDACGPDPLDAPPSDLSRYLDDADDWSRPSPAVGG